MPFRHRIISLCIACAMLTSTNAVAAPGDGLQAGNLVLSPGVTLSTAFNSNLFRLSTQEQAVIGAPYVQLVPFLTMSSSNGDAVDFRLDARVGWQQYLPIPDDVVLGQSGLTADVGADLTFNKAGAVSFAIGERLQRTNEAPPEPSDAAYNRLVNRLGATLGVHPGGRVFQHYLSYDWNVHLYDEFPEINKTLHDFTLKNYWRFLPKTAAVLNADFQLVQYSQESRNSGAFANVESSPLRLTGGLSGLITKRLSLKLLGGWGFGFYKAGTDFSSYLVDAQAAFLFGSLAEKNRLFLGYERNFQDSTVANFASYHRPYAGYEQGFMNRRLRLDLRGEVMIRDYVGSPVGDFTNASGETVTIGAGLNDLLVGVSAGVNYNIRKWWEVGATYKYSANLTDDELTISNGPDLVRGYSQHLISLSTTVRY